MKPVCNDLLWLGLGAALFCSGCTGDVDVSKSDNKPDLPRTVIGATQIAGANHEKLKPFEWLEGEWVARTVHGERVVDAINRYEWTLDGDFLSSTLTVAIDGEVISKAQTMTGWDASTESIRAWGFVSREGGNAVIIRESTWHQDGDAWVDTGKFIHQDGQVDNGVTVRERLSEDSFTLETVVEGTAMPTQTWQRRTARRKQRNAD